MQKGKTNYGIGLSTNNASRRADKIVTYGVERFLKDRYRLADGPGRRRIAIRRTLDSDGPAMTSGHGTNTGGADFGTSTRDRNAPPSEIGPWTLRRWRLARTCGCNVWKTIIRRRTRRDVYHVAVVWKPDFRRPDHAAIVRRRDRETGRGGEGEGRAARNKDVVCARTRETAHLQETSWLAPRPHPRRRRRMSCAAHPQLRRRRGGVRRKFRRLQ